MAYDKVTGDNPEALQTENLLDYEPTAFKLVRKCVWCGEVKGVIAVRKDNHDIGICPSCVRHLAHKDLAEHRQEPDKGASCQACSGTVHAATGKYVFSDVSMNLCDGCASRLIYRHLKQGL